KTRWNDLLGGLAVGRSKQTCELTSSIVPRGTSFHHLVELEFPPISDLVECSRCNFPGPSELRAVNPDAMHDHRQAAGQRDNRSFHAAAPGDLHRPSLEPGPLCRTQHALGWLRRAWFASSRRRSAIWRQGGLFHQIDPW